MQAQEHPLPAGYSPPLSRHFTVTSTCAVCVRCISMVYQLVHRMRVCTWEGGAEVEEHVEHEQAVHGQVHRGEGVRYVGLHSSSSNEHVNAAAEFTCMQSWRVSAVHASSHACGVACQQLLMQPQLELLLDGWR